MASAAIVGMSCRLSGHIDDPEKLWELCSRAQCTAGPTPPGRFNAQQFYHPAASKPGHFNVCNGSYLAEDISRFDAAFFNITEAEAKTMDPQHRILLECAFTALESAGIDLNQISGRTDVGVFAASSQGEYIQQINLELETANRYTATGNAASMFANRLSYFFNVRGPSLTTDTACSASLSALHLALESLRRGECNVAIVTGSYIQVAPMQLSYTAGLGASGAKGKSFSFDHRAEGYGRGDGVGCLVLKALDLAENDQDPIRAVLRATALNHSGRSAGITLPNEQAQRELIRKVYHNAGLDPRETAYIECHGTGTARGDPIEARAVAAAFSGAAGQQDQTPLYIGSIKANIGHTETASGIMSVIKSVLMLERETILPLANFEQVNPEIDVHGLGLGITTSCQPWPRGKAKRISINNFGFGGSNAHAIIEQAPSRGKVRSQESKEEDKGHLLFVFSAKDTTALQATLQAYAVKVHHEAATEDSNHQNCFLKDLSYTLCCRRTHFNWRCAVTASSCEELAQKLQATEQSGRLSLARPLIWAFTGQGAQWAKQGTELLRFPVYRACIEEADRLLREFGAPWSLLKEISRHTQASHLDQAQYAQPAVTALQIALVLLLESWGIRASINCGHSSGEIGAAFACGALDLRSCMAIAYFRGQATTEMNGMGRKGAMIAVGADAALVGPLVSSTKTGFATIACYNSPRSLTVSGDEAAVQELKCMLDARGIFNRLLAVDVAYHSNHMLEVADWYLHRLRSMNLGGREGVEQKTFISSLMAFDLDAALLRCPEYWVLNLTSPVQFSASMSIALDKVSEAAASMPVIVEIGPHHALRGPIREIVQSRAAEDPTQKPAYVPSLKRGGCSNDDVLELVASLLNAGQPVEAASVARATLSPDRRVLTDLPPYAFTRDKQYWQTSRAHQLSYYGSTPWNVLLGHRIASDAGSTLQFRHLFSLEDVPWLKDHQISGQIIFPMAGYICAVLEALTMTTPPTVVSSATGFLLREIVISKAFVLQEQEPNDMLIRLTPQRMDTRSGGSADTYAFEISSWTQQSGFVEHCRGLANQTKPDSANVVSPSFSLQRGVEQTRARVKQLRQACTNSVPCDAFYERAAQSGLQYGPSFQLLTSLWTGFNEAWGTIEPFDTASVMPQQFEPQLILHPTLLDAMLHTGFCNAGGVRGDPKGIRCHVPTFVQELRIQASHDKPLASKLDVYVSVSEHSAAQRSTTQDFVAVDQGSGSAVIEMRGLKMFKMDDGLLQNAAHVDVVNPLTVEWHLHPDFLSSATLTEMRDKRQDVEEEEEARWRREQACYYWIERALLSAPSKPKPIYLQRLRRWMRRTVARITSAPPSSRESAWPSMSREDRDRFLDGFEADGADGDFYANAGTNLGAILREEVTSLDVLMQDNRLNRIYDETTCVVPAFHLAGDVIDQISHQNPFMRICEVGSGMGGSTIRVLEKIMQPLPRCSSYYYTDVSTGFFDAARNKFAAYSDILNFKRLDIVEDIEQQGFEPHSYDVVLAGDVIHATPDVQESLCNVRKLLKPDGVFVLVELFGDAAATLPFATLPGWWHHEEGPTLSLDDWNLRLEQAGFTGIDCEIKDNPGFPLHSVILARPQSVRAPAPAPSPRNVELLSTGGDIDSHLAKELAKALIPSNIVNDKGNLPNGHSHNTKADHQQQTSSEAVKTDHATTSHMQTKPRNVSVCIDELFKPLLAMPTPAQLAHIQGWFTNTREVLWVTRRRSAEMDGVLSDFAFGFARCVRQELAGLKLVVLQLEDTDQSDLAEAAAAIAMVFNHCFVKRRGIKESELDFRFTQGSLRFPRVMPLPHIVQDMRRDDGIAECKLQPLFQDDRIHTLRIDEVGSLSRLYFASTVLPYDLDDDELLIQISATGLNFKDLLKALGQVPGQSLGIECCGVVVRAGHNASRGFKPGDRVMHIGAGDMFASQARIASQSVVKVPECINDHEAAAIGVIYVTAYESLVTVAKLQPGETVLIHAAAGGVGQAAIMIAQWIGAEVYCTVGTPGKKDLLISEFGIAEDRIFWSRSADFSRCIQLVTRGRGVDVLLNCLSGDLLRASWNCMAQFGRFVEIGRRDFQDNTLLEMAPFGKALTYAAVDVAALVDFKPSYVRQVLQIVVDLVASGAVRPPKPLNVVPVSGAPQAFRNLQGGKTPGKTVVVNEASSMVNVMLNAASTTAIRSDRSYLITGGTGGLGRSLTRWLIARGASEIILASRVERDSS